ncbi:MAG: hypothetical protein HYZ54_08190 [Ignavibacteriae bacterium]|nr:hypothetical protein [Ignavibacteriota bacterium]
MKKTCNNYAVAHFCMAAPNLFAGDPVLFFNPGFKLGYTFGEKGGFTGGFEFSLTGLHFNNNVFLSGVVLDIDFCKERTKIK